MIVVLDASSLVSAALKQNSVPERALLAAISPPNLIVTSREVEDEYREVLFRPKFDRFASVQRRTDTLDLILSCARQVLVTAIVRACRDPKDDKYLALAATAGADAIISSDDDLLAMAPWRGIPIVTPAEFLALSDLSAP
ncbi:putative toxin-antitoxin system toxin component, PIN family [Acidisoma sp. C75]